jgi:amidase
VVKDDRRPRPPPPERSTVINRGSIDPTINSDDLAFAGAARQAELLADGAIGAVELLDSTLARIEATQSTVNAFRCLRPDAARAEATDAERRLAAGERLPLLGVPVAIKDDMDLAGESTPFGCTGEFEPKSADGEVARRLRAAGAVIVGKTNTPEIGQWPFTESPGYGVTRNPWSLGHTPGGSSGGAAAAVAAGLVPAAIGSDGAGSIRIPAAWTHLVGLKPQRGRISTWPEAEAFNGLTANGPLTRTVADSALLLDALAGNVDGDLHRPRPHAESFTAAAAADPGQLRIALALNIPFSGAPACLASEVGTAVEGLAVTLEALGHHVEQAEVPYGVMPSASIMPRSMAGIRDWAGRAPDRSQLDPRTHHAAALGRALNPLLGLAHFAEQVARRRVGRIFRGFDLVLTPTTAQPPLPIGACDGLSSWATDKRVVAACPYAWPWNILGWPALNIPAGLTTAGLPIGAQLLGPAHSEPRLLALGAQLERERRWQERRPEIAVP